MRIVGWLRRPRTQLDIVAGLVDGILTALILAARRFLQAGSTADFGLALHLCTATGLTTLFIFFLAHYAELRAELVRAERQLNLLAAGRLATTRLGADVAREAVGAAILAAACSVLGSAIPILFSMSLARHALLAMGGTIGVLGILGFLLARSFYGSALIWSLVTMGGGVFLTYVGIHLDLVG